MEKIYSVLLQQNDKILVNNKPYTIKYGNYTENGINKIGLHAQCDFMFIEQDSYVSIENLPVQVIKNN